MVAIALYRGNLHRVPNTPRRWPPPPRSLSASQFRSLLRRRSLALSRLYPESTAPEVKEEREDEARESEEKPAPLPSVVKEEKTEEKPKQEEEEEAEEGELLRTSSDMEIDLPDHDPDPVKEEEVTTAAPEVALPDKEQRKLELEKKLEELNQKKHNLVQMLKQILNAEEEMKRRINPSNVTRASGPVLSESGVDVAAANRPGPPKMSVEVNFSTDLVGESDPGSTQSTHTRPFSQVQSPSPSGVSLSRSPFSHALRGPQASNSLLGNPLTSPSRFVPPTPTGQLGHASSLPPLLPLPGSTIASSPSPAASAGMPSVFRDSRFGNSS